ncbi:3-hydroxyisobutyrate dehydrogenase [Microdochium nivale]|nr:3-hydroxyisobutyrate dehydrogenase [Microdochium nivale]
MPAAESVQQDGGAVRGRRGARGVACGSAGEVLGGSDVVFLSLSDDAAVLAMIDTLIGSTSSAQESPVKGKIIIDTTTVHPDTTRRVAEMLAAHDARFAAMPVFGPAPVAAAGQLVAAFAGPADVLELVGPFIRGRRARGHGRGEEPEKAVLLKTTSNLLTATITQAIAEAHVLAAKTGLPASTLERLLELNLGAYAHVTSQRMTSGVYCPAPGTAPWSDLDLALKDVGHGVDTAEGQGIKLRAGRAALESLQMAKRWAERNGGDDDGEGSGGVRRLDSSSLFGAIREENGLDFETDVVKERDGKKTR